MREKQSPHFSVKRTVIGALLLLLALGLTTLPASVFSAIIQVFSLALMYEFHRAAFPKGAKHIALLGLSLNLLITTLVQSQLQESSLLILLGLLLISGSIMKIPGRPIWLKNSDRFIFGILYTAVLPSHLFLLRAEPEGIYLLLLLVTAVVVTDSTAYFVGKRFGRHLLWQVVSPNKSWEGAVGGLLLGGLAGFLFINSTNLLALSWIIAIVLSAVLCIGTILGDLVESSIKRHLQIKDFSELIPEHGGLLDRTDSMIFVATVLYWSQLLIR